MQIEEEPSAKFIGRLKARIGAAAEGGVAITTADTHQWRVYGPVTLADDFIEFHPESTRHKPIAISLDQIVSFQ